MKENKKRTLSEFITATFTKNTLRLFAVVVAFAVVIILSIGQFALDFEHINWQKWASNTILLTSIQIVFMVLGEGSRDIIRQNPSGLYNRRLGEYRAERIAVSNYTNSFAEYHLVHRDKVLKEKIISRLQNEGVIQAREIFENLTEAQILTLTNTPIEKNGIEFPAFMDKGEHAKKIIDIIRNTRIGLTTPIYYLTEDAGNECMTDQDVPEILEKKKKYIRRSGRFVKIVMGTSLSIVWAAFTVQDFMDGSDLQAWYNLITRIFSGISGLINGFMIAFGVNGIECRELNEKTMFIHNFKIEYEQHIFVPTTLHEKFMKQKKEQEEKEREQEEFNKTVEIITPPENTPLEIEEKKVINL